MIHLKALPLVLVSLLYCSYSFSQEIVSVIVVPAVPPDPQESGGSGTPSYTYVVINDCSFSDTCEPSESTITETDNDTDTSTPGIDDTLTLSGQTIYRTEIGVNDLPVKDRPDEEIIIGALGNNQKEMIDNIEIVSLEEYEEITIAQAQLQEQYKLKQELPRQSTRALLNGLAQSLLHEKMVESQYRN